MCFACVYSERTRVRTCKIQMIACIINATVSKLLLFQGYDLQVTLQKYLLLIEAYDAWMFPILVLLTAVSSLAVNIIGIYVFFRCLYPLQRKQVMVQLCFHQYANGLSCLLLLFVSLLSSLHQWRMEATFRGGFLQAMKDYKHQESVKVTMDEMQISYECCGSSSYMDWFHVSWIEDMFINANNPDVRDRLENGAYESDDVPFSCCDPTSPRPCITRGVHDDMRHFNYLHTRDLTISKRGCRETLMERYYLDAILPIFFISTLLIFFNSFVLIKARYLQTSMLRALELGNPQAETHGYVSVCCLVLSQEMFGSILKPDEQWGKDENNRPPVPALFG